MQRLLLASTGAVVLLLSATPASGAATPAPDSSMSPVATVAPHRVVETPVCRRAGHNGRVGCFAIRVDHKRRHHHHHRRRRHRHVAAPSGYGPAALASAYHLPAATAGSGQTVAIVDAFDDPNAEHDLGVYRRQFGLPTCTTANHCFRKVDQAGHTDYPDTDTGWAEEISLDLDIVSAVCPKCHILLVEAKTPSMANLGTAEDTAVRLGADAVSNSWGGPDASDRSYGRYFHHPGVAITAASGDNGYGASYPATSKWVTAVGGTTLRTSSSARGYSETAWSDGGSGCSTRNATTWQDDTVTGCDGRAVADVAAVADPSTGVAVYDSLADDGQAGWLTFGGTSAAAPLIAAVFALAGNAGDVVDGSYVWSHHTGNLHDVRSGSNGSCDTAQWCHARTGWDGPTGWGTPDGVGAF
ncbi:MAG TPA: S8 family serine peptidase [Mycobacteriales bacterium]|nr:S8 family serine peptidase [Mycobacteriales bacterium]